MLKKNVICTLNWTRDEPFFMLCTKTKIAYANKIGADFILLTDVRYPFVGMAGGGIERLIVVRDALHDYERILYLDGDILVNPAADNIFESFPDRNFGYMHEQGWCDWCSGPWSAHFAPKVPTWRLNTSGFREYYNVGTMLFSKEQRQLFDNMDMNEYLETLSPGAEQSYLNYYIQKFNTPMRDIGTKWNKMDYDNRGKQYDNSNRRNAHFIHYAGGGFSGLMRKPKPQVIQDDFNIWYPQGLPDYSFQAGPAERGKR